MKFLSKLLEYMTKGLMYVQGFSQVVQQIDPKLGGPVQIVSKDLGEIFDSTVDAEKIVAAMKDSTKTGADKAAIAGPLIGDIILQSAALVGHQIADQDLFNQGVAKITSGSADVVNSLHADGLSQMVVVKSK